MLSTSDNLNVNSLLILYNGYGYNLIPQKSGTKIPAIGNLSFYHNIRSTKEEQRKPGQLARIIIRRAVVGEEITA